MKEIKDQFAQKFGEMVLRLRWPFVLLSIILMLSAGFGMKNLWMNSDYRYFFGEDNPQRIAFEKLQDVYSKEDSAIFAITSKSGDVFNAKTLAAVADLTEKAWKLPFSNRVDSITNYQHTESVEDDLIVEKLVSDSEAANPSLLTNERLAKIKNIALNEPLLVQRIISPNSKMTAVNVRINLPGKSPMEVPQVAAAVRKLADEFRKNHPDHEVHLSGIAMLNNAFNEAGMSDMMTLTPIMYGVILLVMFLLLRTISAVVATLIVIMFSIVTGMGVAGWLGIPITPPSSIAPTVIVTLAIADSVHILKSLLGFMRRGMSKADAIVSAIRVNLQPVFLTSFTTVIGFLSLNFSDTPPFHDLGNITAAGVTGAFIYSIFLLPALMSFMPLKVKQGNGEEEVKLNKFADWIVLHRGKLVIGTIFLVVFLAAQIPKIKLNDQFVQYFDESIQFRTDADYVMKNLSGIYQVNFDLKAGESQGVSKPEFLQKVEEFTQWYRTVPGVMHVNSVTDTFKRLNKNLHGDDPSFYRLPESRELAAQYLLLYEMSLPYGLDLNNQIDVDKSATKVIITLGDLETNDIIAIAAKGEEWLKKNAPESMHTIASSPAVMFSYITIRNVKAMFWGTLLAFGLITIVLIISLKSFKYGMISLLPNLVPAIMAFGIWSLAVGTAGFAIAIVTSVTIGIVVDDTVHFLSKYVRAKREGHSSTHEAIRYSFSNVGVALVVTSIILVLGFSVLMLSPFKMNAVLGALSALTIAIALIVDFFFLPAVLAMVDGVDNKELNKSSKGKLMNIKNVSISIVAAVLALGLGSQVKAQELKATEPVAKGLEVAKNIDIKNNGFVNQVAKVEMILKNKHGQESTRSMRIKTLEVSGDGDKSLTIFDSPRDVKGTAFLSFTHSVGADDQWLFLPALKRVKRISSNNKSGPFMGSEFAYEDITSQEVDKYTYKYIKKEKVAGENGHVVERYPVDKNSGYTKQIVWVDAKEWRTHKIEFYDRKGSLLKTLEQTGFKKYANNQWRPDVMKMVNHQNDKSTSLVWRNYKFKQNISEKDFNKVALKRVR
jgi:predicted RND superfamily exporter protein